MSKKIRIRLKKVKIKHYINKKPNKKPKFQNQTGKMTHSRTFKNKIYTLQIRLIKLVPDQKNDILKNGK